MRNAKKLGIAIMALGAQAGCSTTHKYHVLVGARSELYSETRTSSFDQSLASQLGGTVTTVTGDPKKISALGFGGQLGIAEDSGFLFTTLALSFTKYAPVHYTFNSSNYGEINQTLNVTGLGLGGAVGLRFLIFKPHLSYEYQYYMTNGSVSGSQVGTTESTSNNSKQFLAGPGFALDIPIAPAIHLVAEAAYRIPLWRSGGVAARHSLLAQVGVLLFNF